MEERKKIKRNDFQIENNLISFSDSMIQISNISQVDVAVPLKQPLNSMAIVAIVLGLLIFLAVPGVEIIGLIVAGCGAGYVFWYKYLNNDESVYLNISLNSGRVYSIICKDKEFLKEVMQVIKYCINNHFTQLVQIDFDNCEMYNSPIVVGNENEVGNGNKNKEQ